MRYKVLLGLSLALLSNGKKSMTLITPGGHLKFTISAYLLKTANIHQKAAR